MPTSHQSPPLHRDIEPPTTAQKTWGTRRDFLRFLGRTTVAGMALTSHFETARAKTTPPPFQAIPPQRTDRLEAAQGFSSHVIIGWGDLLNRRGDSFGYNNDFTQFLPLWGDHDGLLWVNHESVAPLFVSGWTPEKKRTREQIEKEQHAVGGTLVRIRYDSPSQRWKMVFDDPHNRRLNALTSIPFSGGVRIAGKHQAKGTLANCSGGTTPWGTLLTCEENTDKFYGDIRFVRGKRHHMTPRQHIHWMPEVTAPPEHYGWVVEVHPLTGRAQKLVSLGRFAHEGVALVTTPDGRCVAYMGDDEYDQYIYKFVAAHPGTLTKGTLYVADVSQGRWLPLDILRQKVLQKHFRDQLDVLIRCHEAATWLGASPMHRPEDIEVDPLTGDVYICLTMGRKPEERFGSILKLQETRKDHGATSFASETWLAGGPKQGFACPDNLIFNRDGQLWMTNDMSSTLKKHPTYSKIFGHNSLYYIPTKGTHAGRTFRALSAPHDAELTGPSLSPDGATMFLSVQHPGGDTYDLKHPTSRWPAGGTTLPRPAVVGIQLPKDLAISPPQRFQSTSSVKPETKAHTP